MCLESLASSAFSDAQCVDSIRNLTILLQQLSNGVLDSHDLALAEPSILRMAVRNHRIGAIAELIPEEVGEMTTTILQMADTDGRTAIHEAASQGHVEILSRLLLPYDRSNAEDQLSSIVDFVPSENVSGRTALHEASGAGHLAMVLYLLDHCHANVDAVDNDGNTSLMFTCQQLHERVGKTLVDRGARYACGIARVYLLRIFSQSTSDLPLPTVCGPLFERFLLRRR